MRVKNKELRQRRHRKEQRIKELIKLAIADKKAGKSAPKAKKAAKAVEEKPKKAAAPKKAKKTEDAPVESVAEATGAEVTEEATSA